MKLKGLLKESRAMAHQFALLLEDRGEDRSALIWKAAWKPTLVTRLAAPIVQRQLRAMFERASKDLAAFVKKRRG